MAKYHGKAGRVYLSTTASGAAVSVGSLTEWSLDQPADRVEVTAFDSNNKEYVQGFRDVSFSLSGFWNDADTTLFSAVEGDEAVRVYLYPSKDAPTKYWYGTAFLDASISVSVSGAVAVTASGQGAATWARN